MCINTYFLVPVQARLITNKQHLVQSHDNPFNPDEDYGSCPESETSAGEEHFDEPICDYQAELENAELDRDSPGEAMILSRERSLPPFRVGGASQARQNKVQQRAQRNVVLRKPCNNQVVPNTDRVQQFQWEMPCMWKYSLYV